MSAERPKSPPARDRCDPEHVSPRLAVDDGRCDDWGDDIERDMLRAALDLAASDTVAVSNGAPAGVHSQRLCARQPWGCWIHTPKAHALSSAPVRWSAEIGVVERICDHGLGHPDPQDVDYWWQVHGRDVAVHPCDGCCGPTPHGATSLLDCEKQRPRENEE